MCLFMLQAHIKKHIAKGVPLMRPMSASSSKFLSMFSAIFVPMRTVSISKCLSILNAITKFVL